MTTTTEPLEFTAVKPFETILLDGLFNSEDFARKVLPFIKKEYFENEPHRAIFRAIEDHIEKHNDIPTFDSIGVELADQKGMKEHTFKEAAVLLGELKAAKDEKKPSDKWLTANTEQFVQNRAMYNTMVEAIQIMEKKGQSKVPMSAIPTMITEALAISFDNKIGHNYTEDTESRFTEYSRPQRHIASGLDELDKITGGGVVAKKLHCLLAGTGVGKSLVMCSLAASYLLKGLNVLYLSAEMDELSLSQRIDANIMDIDMDDIETYPPVQLQQMWDKSTVNKNLGKLIIKEYPTASAHVGHVRFLLKELEIKNGFVPDIMFVDYLNIFISQRMKSGGSSSYEYVKATAEEFRGLMMEYKIPGWTATQVNRTGFSSDDVDMTDVSESFGVPMTLDLFIALMTNDDLHQQQLLLWKQLKNRYTDVYKNPRFVTGINRPKMRVYNVAQPAAITSGTTATGVQATVKKGPTQGKSNFSGGPPRKPSGGQQPQQASPLIKGKFDKTTLSTDILV